MTDVQLNQLIAWSTVAVAFATIVLAVCTGLYLRATNRLVRLQREPILHIGMPTLSDEEQEVLIRNAGADPIINIAVYPRHLIFGDANKPPIMSQGRQQPGDVISAWWVIPRLEPDGTVKRSLSGEIEIYWRNHESMRHYVEKGTEPSSLFLLDVDFQREIDRKEYQITKLAHLVQVDMNGEKLVPMLMEPDYRFSNLKQAIELNSAHPVRGDTRARRT